MITSTRISGMLTRFAFYCMGAIAMTSALGASASADGDCDDWLRRYLPRLYEIRCSGGKGRARPGEAYSSFADSFNVNPASVPTEPSPYGIETIGTYPKSDTFKLYPSFSLIKGFHKIGTAVSTSGNNTFYGNDVVSRGTSTSSDVDLENTEPARGHLTNLNFGTAFALNRPASSNEAAPSLGLSLRYNHITNTVGWGAGVAVSVGRLGLGVGFSKEKVSNFLPPIWFYSVVVGYKLPIIELEYTHLTNEGGYDLGPVQILTVSATASRFVLSAAVRRLNYLKIGDVTQVHYAAQVQVFSHLSVGYLINYIPGTHSVATQVFF